MGEAFIPRLDDLSRPADHAAAVTPSDTEDLTYTARALYIGVSGDVKVLTLGGEAVTFSNVPEGILPVRVERVYSTGTTATSLVALW